MNERTAAAWTPVTRIVFRFAVVYLGLFCVVTQISGSMLPNLSFYYRGLGRLPPMRDLTLWIAQHVFGEPIRPEDIGGAGEPLFFWVQALWILVVSALATTIWSILDRRRTEYVTLHGWFRLFVRFALAAALFEYGMTKVIPTQFPAPSLTTLVTPAGDLSLSALLWTAVGAAPAYQILTGCVEVLAGILLIVPATTRLGAVIGAAALVQVFLMNMAFDIGLKLVSFHLIVLALFLLAPDARRLGTAVLTNDATGAVREPSLTRTKRGARYALAAQLAAGAYLLAMYAYINVGFWRVEGGGAPKSPLYGIWNVEALSINGERRPPQFNEYDRRWRRVIFDTPDAIIFQRTDDSFARYGASIDVSAGTFVLRKGASRTWRADFRYERLADNRLVVDGSMDGRAIVLQLERVELDTLRLLNSSFRWVRPHDQ